MGIRFEIGNIKPTNSPVIYYQGLDFGDSIVDAVNNAYAAKLNFYAYVYPQSNFATFGSNEIISEGLDTPGFIVSGFIPDSPLINIPFSKLSSNKKFSTFSDYKFPVTSTSKEDYFSEVNEIIKLLDNNEQHKIVASRVKIKDEIFLLGNLFQDLWNKNPDAFIFCFYTEPTGCWIGASPELLLKINKTKISSMSLAGTRDASLLSDNWDKKNIIEQNIVTIYIQNIFKKFKIDLEIKNIDSLSAGDVEHICTNLEGRVNGDLKPSDLKTLLKELSPTPALCGFPKKEALDFILNNEKFVRGCYGGFCGPYNSIDNLMFHVILRCASLSDKMAAIFAGGGITSRSNPEDEWIETELKMQTIEKSMNSINNN